MESQLSGRLIPSSKLPYGLLDDSTVDPTYDHESSDDESDCESNNLNEIHDENGMTSLTVDPTIDLKSSGDESECESDKTDGIHDENGIASADVSARLHTNAMTF